MKDSPEIVALLPMKAHSERVPNKNFRLFSGRPLFQWILEALLAVPEISKIVINTDAGNILKQYRLLSSERVVIRNRKPDLCGDFVSMNKIIEDDIQHVPADMYLMTHATNPLLRSETISAAILKYQHSISVGDSDSLFTVTSHQTRFYKGDGTPVNHDPGNLIRTQDLEIWYEENSNLYIFSRDSFMKTNARIGKRPILFAMPRWEAIDIDDQETWDMAEMIAGSKWFV